MSFRNGCKHRWKLDHVQGKRSKNYSIHMDFGTAVHETIENMKQRKNPLFKSTDKAAGDFFEKSFRDLFSKNSKEYRDKDKKVDVEWMVSAGKNIISRFDDCKEVSEAEVVYNEHALKLPIERTDDVKIDFKGFVDMVIKTKDVRGNTVLYVCDFKTCSWGWDVGKRQDKELHFQIMLYKHFLCKKFDLDPKNVRTAFLLLKKRPRKDESPIEFFSVSAGPVSVQRALDEFNSDISEMIDRAAKDDFPKDRKYCVNDYGDTCPYLNSLECPGEIGDK